jgi:hypothetical protein
MNYVFAMLQMQQLASMRLHHLGLLFAQESFPMMLELERPPCTLGDEISAGTAASWTMTMFGALFSYDGPF